MCLKISIIIKYTNAVQPAIAQPNNDIPAMSEKFARYGIYISELIQVNEIAIANHNRPVASNFQTGLLAERTEKELAYWQSAIVA